MNRSTPPATAQDQGFLKISEMLVGTLGVDMSRVEYPTLAGANVFAGTAAAAVLGAAPTVRIVPAIGEDVEPVAMVGVGLAGL